MQDIQGALVIDDKNKDHLTKFVLPVSETTEDAGPRRIEQTGSVIVDSTRRARLRPFAEKLVEWLHRRRGAVTAATSSKFSENREDSERPWLEYLRLALLFNSFLI